MSLSFTQVQGWHLNKPEGEGLLQFCASNLGTFLHTGLAMIKTVWYWHQDQQRDKGNIITDTQIY